MLVPVIIIRYLFICAHSLSLSFIYFVRYLIYIYSLFDFCSLFVVQQKDSLLILDCIPGILILLYLLNKVTIIIYASQ